MKHYEEYQYLCSRNDCLFPEERNQSLDRRDKSVFAFINGIIVSPMVLSTKLSLNLSGIVRAVLSLFHAFSHVVNRKRT
jgi:hypothetical protein